MRSKSAASRPARRTGLPTILLATWALAWLVVFMVYPGSRSVIHHSSLDHWREFIPKLAGIDGAGYLFDLLRAFAGMLFMTTACLGVGLIAIRSHRGLLFSRPTRGMQWLGRLCVAIVLGQGVLSVVFLTLAEARFLLPSLVTAVAATGFLGGIYLLIREVTETMPRAVLGARRWFSGEDLPMAILAAVLCVFALSYSSSRLSYDAVALYFSSAKATALARQLQYFLDDSFVASMFHTGIMYSAVIQLAGDQAARMYSWLNGVVLACLGMVLLDALGQSRKSQLIMVVLLLSTTAALDLMGDGKIDLASSTPALAAVYLLVQSRGGTWRDHALVGLLAGQAMAARPYNLFMLGSVFLIYLFVLSLQSEHRNRRWSLDPLRSLIPVALGAMPWLAYHVFSNWIILGDAFAFVRDFLGVGSDRWQWALPPSQLWLYRLLYPVIVSIYNTPQSLGTISPAVLAFLPVLWRRHVDVPSGELLRFRAISIAAAATLVIWLLLTFMIFEIRYVLFLWLLLFIPLSTRIADVLTGPDVLLRQATRAFLITLLGFLLVRVTYITLDSYSPIDAQGNAHCSGITFCDYLESINAAAEPGARVLTLAAFRYYLRQDLLACSTSHEEYVALRQADNSDLTGFWIRAYQYGFRYFAYERNYTERHLYFETHPGPLNTPAWLELERLDKGNGGDQALYRIQLAEPAVLPDRTCSLQNGVWSVHPVAAPPG